MSSSYNKILGCLYGQAIGDAMGMPSELWPQSKVKSFFSWIDTFLPGPKENIAASTFNKGQYTDDTQLAIAMMDSVISQHGKIDPYNIAEHILSWAERTHAFEHNILGPTSKASLLALRNGTPIEQISANGITNGAAMRIAPIGCLIPTTMPTQFIEQVALACSATHKSDIAIAGATAIAWAVSRSIEGTDWQKIKQELLPLVEQVQQQYESTFSPSLSRRIESALKLAGSLQKSNDEFVLSELYQVIGAGMDTIESVPCALALVDIGRCDPMRIAELAANLGGDTDTIGAMACAIAGAYSGIEAMTVDAIELINQANQINFRHYAISIDHYRSQRLTTQGDK